MTKTVLTEQQLVRFINEQIHTLLTEDKESKNMAKARKYLKDNGSSDNDAMTIVNNIRHDIPNTRINQNKFMLGTTRFYHTGQLKTADDIMNLNKLLLFIGKKYDNQFDNNLNGLSLSELLNRFEPEINHETNASKDTLGKQKYSGKSDYQVVQINTFEEANKYSDYVGWCVLTSMDAFNKYTKNGLCPFYFLLRNGYENVKREVGENAPKDEYGLSMIAVSVNEDGSINSSTSRWNHDNGGDDNLFSADELSQLLGRNFYDVCRPYSKEELQRKKDIINKPFLDAQRRLEAGEDPDDIFDYVRDFYDGFARVKLNDKWNYINTNGELVSPNQWFDLAGDFEDGFAKVKLNGKWNYINASGKILSPNQWFDNTGDFKNGFAKVELNNRFNFINTNGELVSTNQWFDLANNFEDGFAMVELNGKYNFINTNGELVSPNQWFDFAYKFKNGFARVELNRKEYRIDNKGNLSKYE